MIALKIHKRDHAHPEILKFDHFPISIGRSVSNHIILQDDTVSAQHCQLYKDERGYFLKDLGSTNAFYSAGVKLREVQLFNGTVVLLGDVRMEFLFDDDNLDKTREIIYRPEHLLSPSAIKGSHKGVLLSFLGLILANSISYYSDKAVSPQISEFFSNLLSMLLTAALLSLFVSFLAKLQSKQYHYLKIFYHILLAVALYQFLEISNDFLSFNIHLSWLATGITILLSGSIFYWLIQGLMTTIMDRVKKRKIQIYSIGVVLSFFSVLALFDFLSSIESSLFNYHGSISYPVRKYSTEAHSMGVLSHKLNSSYQKIEKYRHDALKKADQ